MRKRIPKNGDISYKIKFAWKPVYIADTRIWLEKYVSIREYIRFHESEKGYWREVAKDFLENLPSRLKQIYNQSWTE